MRRAKYKEKRGNSLETRIIGLFASLFFSIPTAVLLWLWLNRELALWGGFLGSSYLWGCIAFFALAAFVAPHVFPAILGAIWRWFLRVERWWG